MYRLCDKVSKGNDISKWVSDSSSCYIVIKVFSFKKKKKGGKPLS